MRWTTARPGPSGNVEAVFGWALICAPGDSAIVIAKSALDAPNAAFITILPRPNMQITFGA
jgi:hypothetical protein